MMMLIQSRLISADCECGYRISDSLLFTDAVQTDFTHMQSLTDTNDWKIKQLRLEYIPNKDRYGRLVEDRNVILNPFIDDNNTTSSQGLSIDPGLQLIVRSTLVETNLVSTGQIQSQREDIRYGSFRAYLKSTPINGTCAASFWYHNDSQEIDIELLSRQQKDSMHPINFSVHSKESVANDYDATNTTGFVEAQLGFDPAKGFHEYRYDWSPELVSYYVDSTWLGDVHDYIPTTPGHFQLSHWSNGFQGWSAGPPVQDALITVAYFRGYFNSTDPDRAKDFEARCGGGQGVGRVCDVRDFEGGLAEASRSLGSTAAKAMSAAVMCRSVLVNPIVVAMVVGLYLLSMF